MTFARSPFNWQGQPSIFSADPNFRRQGSSSAEEVLRVSKVSNIAYSTRDNTKTLKIVGRRNEARSQ